MPNFETVKDKKREKLKRENKVFLRNFGEQQDRMPTIDQLVGFNSEVNSMPQEIKNLLKGNIFD